LLVGSVAFSLFTTVARSADIPAFSDSLSTEQKAAVALSKLSPDQVAALNAQVKREITVAQQGDAKGFASSFTHRQTPQERASAGLDQLSTPELRALDALVAERVAHPPVVSNVPARTTAVGVVETVTHKPQMHGEVTLTYGMGSGGRNFYGGSMVSTYVDPDKGYSLTIGLSQYRGNGYFGRYGYGWRGGPYRDDGLGLYPPYDYGYGYGVYGPYNDRGW
jgi:hypothetical protein